MRWFPLIEEFKIQERSVSVHEWKQHFPLKFGVTQYTQTCLKCGKHRLVSSVQTRKKPLKRPKLM